MAGLPPIDEAVLTDARCASVAVVIGVEDYAALPDVPGARRDAAAFASFVERTLACPAPTVLGEAADRATLLAALASAGRTPGIRTVWVYFSGHGASPVQASLLAADAPADPTTWSDHGVRVDEVRSLATAGGADLVLLVDASLDGVGRDGVELVPGRRFPAPRAVPLAPGDVEWWASAPGEAPRSVEGGGHGAFTWAALGALRGWADGVAGRPDTRVSGHEAERFALDALAEVGVDQHPVLRGDRLRILSTAHEPRPSLDPWRWTEPAPPAPTLAEPTATLAVTLSVDGALFVDGEAVTLTDRAARVGVAAGRHLVEVRTDTGIPLAGLHVDVADGQAVALTYRDRQLLVSTAR